MKNRKAVGCFGRVQRLAGSRASSELTLRRSLVSGVEA